VLRKTILTDSKSEVGHLGYPDFPAMYEFVIPVILHFKRFLLLNSAGNSYYKTVITRSELQAGRISSDV
jgi:hypothetical protein